MSRLYLILTLVLVAVSVGMFLTTEMLGGRVEPYWIALPVLCTPPVLLVVWRFPAGLIPPVMFMGSFKMQPAASNLDFRVPTLWALCLLLATMLVHALLTLAGNDRPSLSDLVRGQRQGIVTYLSFAGVVTFSYLYSRAPEYGFTELTHFLVIGSALYFSSLFLVRSEADIRHLTTSALLLSVALTGLRFLAISNYSGLAVRPDGTIEDITRIAAGQLIGMTMLLLLLAPQSMCVRVPRQLLLVCLPWLAAGLTICLARGPILSFIVIIVVTLLTSKRQIGLLSRRVTLFGLVLLAPVFLVSLSWVQRTETAQIKVAGKTGELANLLNLSDPGGSAGERLHFYKEAIEGFTEKPFVGWGLGSFSVYATRADTREYPHNLLLQIAMEQGLAGLIAFGALLVALFRTLKKTIAATHGEWIFFLWIVLYLMSTSMFSGDLDDQRPLMLWCGMAFCSWRILKLRSQQRPVGVCARFTPPMLPSRLSSP
jgi:O-antigen ligase